MRLFTKAEPILEFDGKSIEKQIESLTALKESLNQEGQNKIDAEIKQLKSGLYGEKSIIFELLNSNIPMHIFHDIYFEYEDTYAQIDFVIVTDYGVFLIESKNMLGNIIINSDGNFIRDNAGFKEGIYSPITQAQRHLDVLTNLIISRQNKLKQITYRNFLPKIFYSVVVFTNPKTIISKRYAPKNIKNKIIKSDGLVSFIKETIKSGEKQPKAFINSLIEFFNFHRITKENNYAEKYRQYELSEEKNLSLLKEKLINYRLEKSRSDNIKPYFIFTNEQLEEILQVLPKTIEELLSIKGFGEFKINNYGEDILKIINS